MRKIHPLVVSVGLLFGLAAQAGNLPLSSAPCGQTKGLESTGFAFSRGSHFYVLASADFVYDTNDPTICHRVSPSGAAPIPLHLLRHDWAAGLALFEGPAELAPFAAAPVFRDGQLLDSIEWDGGKGVLVAQDSLRHHFASVGGVFEESGTASSSSLVGAAVATAGGKIDGFVASQLIEKIPGHSSRVVRWLDRLQATSTGLLIFPSGAVKSWLELALDPSWMPPFALDFHDQLKSVFRFLMGPLAFEERCPPPEVEPGTDSDYPIGGGDPVGIGGDPVSQPACYFTVTNTSAPIPATLRADWLKRIQAYLAKSPDLRINLGYYRASDTHLLAGLGLVSIGHLGQALLNPADSFLLGLTGAAEPTDPALVDLRKSAACVLDYGVGATYDLIGIRERAYLYGGLTLTDDWQAVTLADFQSLLADAASPHLGSIFSCQPLLDDLNAIIAFRKALGH